MEGLTFNFLLDFLDRHCRIFLIYMCAFILITFLKPGQTVLNFEYKRPWETVEPLETKDYIVTVTENGRIKIED